MGLSSLGSAPPRVEGALQVKDVSSSSRVEIINTCTSKLKASDGSTAKIMCLLTGLSFFCTIAPYIPIGRVIFPLKVDEDSSARIVILNLTELWFAVTIILGVCALQRCLHDEKKKKKELLLRATHSVMHKELGSSISVEQRVAAVSALGCSYILEASMKSRAARSLCGRMSFDQIAEGGSLAVKNASLIDFFEHRYHFFESVLKKSFSLAIKFIKSLKYHNDRSTASILQEPSLEELLTKVPFFFESFMLMNRGRFSDAEKSEIDKYWAVLEPIRAENMRKETVFIDCQNGELACSRHYLAEISATYKTNQEKATIDLKNFTKEAIKDFLDFQAGEVKVLSYENFVTIANIAHKLDSKSIDHVLGCFISEFFDLRDCCDLNQLHDDVFIHSQSGLWSVRFAQILFDKMFPSSSEMWVVDVSKFGLLKNVFDRVGLKAITENLKGLIVVHLMQATQALKNHPEFLIHCHYNFAKLGYITGDIYEKATGALQYYEKVSLGASWEKIENSPECAWERDMFLDYCSTATGAAQLKKEFFGVIPNDLAEAIAKRASERVDPTASQDLRYFYANI